MTCRAECPGCGAEVETMDGMTVIRRKRRSKPRGRCWQCGEPTNDRSPRPLCRGCREEYLREDAG